MKRIIMFFMCLLFALYATDAAAQSNQPTLYANILHLDSAFWNAYNNCDSAAFKNFFTDDVEFFHDKGGITMGAAALIQSINKNLCSNNNYRLRREAVAGTVKVFPMQNGNEVYGAIITGEHLFYITENGKPEYLDGDANFTHLWLYKNNEWKMARILSYNHHAAGYINKRKEVALTAIKLNALTGNYKSNQFGTMKIERSDNVLMLTAGNKSYMLYPQSATMFFTKDRDLTFEFIVTDSKPVKMIVREHGAVTDEAEFVQ